MENWIRIVCVCVYVKMYEKNENHTFIATCESEKCVFLTGVITERRVTISNNKCVAMEKKEVQYVRFYYQLPTTHYQLPTTHYQLQTTYYLLPLHTFSRSPSGDTRLKKNAWQKMRGNGKKKYITPNPLTLSRHIKISTAREIHIRGI